MVHYQDLIVCMLVLSDLWAIAASWKQCTVLSSHSCWLICLCGKWCMPMIGWLMEPNPGSQSPRVPPLHQNHISVSSQQQPTCLPQCPSEEPRGNRCRIGGEGHIGKRWKYYGVWRWDARWKWCILKSILASPSGPLWRPVIPALSRDMGIYDTLVAGGKVGATQLHSHWTLSYCESVSQ